MVFPTTSLYGLGANPFDTGAVERIFQVKGRARENPILVLIGRLGELHEMVSNIPTVAEAIIERFWPGGLTLVFKARGMLPSALTGGTGKIGVRLCAHPTAAALTEAHGGPITGTSANASGNPGAWRIQDLEREISEGVDLILDAGPLKGGVGSTVVDVTGSRPSILREGAVPRVEIDALIA